MRDYRSSRLNIIVSDSRLVRQPKTYTKQLDPTMTLDQLLSGEELRERFRRDFDLIRQNFGGQLRLAEIPSLPVDEVIKTLVTKTVFERFVISLNWFGIDYAAGREKVYWIRKATKHSQPGLSGLINLLALMAIKRSELLSVKLFDGDSSRWFRNKIKVKPQFSRMLTAIGKKCSVRFFVSSLESKNTYKDIFFDYQEVTVEDILRLPDRNFKAIASCAGPYNEKIFSDFFDKIRGIVEAS